MIKVYYDFAYPNEENRTEHGLYRMYFKYTREDLLRHVEPLLREDRMDGMAALAAEGIRGVLGRTRRLPCALCLNGRGADVLHLFIRVPVFLDLPWISEWECIDQLAKFFGYNAHAAGFRRSLARILEHRNFKRVIVNCQASVAAFHALGIPSHKVTVSYPVVHQLRKRRHTETRTVKLLFNFGSNPLFFSKGGKEVLDSFRALRAKHAGLQLMVVGNDCSGKIQMLDGVEYHGFVSHDTYLREILPAADVLVHPTHMDSFGYVILEGMASGLPVVATKHYAIPEMITHDSNGYLVDDYNDVWYDTNYVAKPGYRSMYHANDQTHGTSAECRHLTEQLVHYLDILIRNPEIRQRMGDSNYQEISEGKFSPVRKIQQMVSIYHQALVS